VENRAGDNHFLIDGMRPWIGARLDPPPLDAAGGDAAVDNRFVLTLLVARTGNRLVGAKITSGPYSSE
jgi:hypothetical protein